MMQAPTMRKATMMVMSPQNMMIAKIRMTEKISKMMMEMKRVRKNSLKKERRKYEMVRNHLKN